jgi:hypothetical protein
MIETKEQPKPLHKQVVTLMWKDGSVTETTMEVIEKYKSFYGEYPYNYRPKKKK